MYIYLSSDLLTDLSMHLIIIIIIIIIIMIMSVFLERFSM